MSVQSHCDHQTLYFKIQEFLDSTCFLSLYQQMWIFTVKCEVSEISFYSRWVFVIHMCRLGLSFLVCEFVSCHFHHFF